MAKVFLVRELEKKLKTLSGLFKVIRTITSTLELDKVLKLITTSIAEIVGTAVCSLRLLDQKRENLILRASYGHTEEYMEKKKSLKSGGSLSGLSAQTKKTVFVRDVQRDHRYTLPELAEKEGLHSLLSVPLITKGNTIGVLNVYSKRVRHFSKFEIELLSTFAGHASIAIENARLLEELQKVHMKTIRVFAAIMDAKDAYTQAHSEQVAKYAQLVAQRLNLSKEERRRIEYASFLHDIGKMDISSEILQKPGKLSYEEWDIMRRHSEMGADIVKQIEFLDGVSSIIHSHHEWYDGRGYPDGLKGEEIPLGARIIAVVDAFQAMVSDRPYRPALSRPEAEMELRKSSGTQSDPKIVEIFLRILKEEEELKERG